MKYLKKSYFKMIILGKLRTFSIYYVIIVANNIYFSKGETLCGKPPDIKNGEAVLPDSYSFSVGSNISYICQKGYKLRPSGSSSTVCLSDNNATFWQPTDIFCDPVCSDLPNLNNGKFDEDRFPPFLPGEFVKYTCNDGFRPETRNSVITCKEENGIVNWTHTEDLCKFSVISCNDPGYIENANRIGHLFTFPHNITYVCNEGFRLIGTATKYCSPKGQWLPNSPVVCEAILCPILSDLPNGKVVSNQRRLNSEATYECDRKFVLSGNKKRICQEDGTWTGNAPICKEITCFHPGALQHGRVFPQKSVYVADDIVIFQCKYSPEQISSKCLLSGEWKFRPPVCPAPKTEASLLSTTTFKPESLDEGLEKKGHSCDDPGTLKNGQRNFNGLGINSTVTYSCDDGYRLVGQGTLQCMPNGKWDLDKLPICVLPLSVPQIIGIVFGVIFLGILGIVGFLWYRWREKRIRGYGEKCKALTADATDLEEITGLDKNKRPIPVTVL